METVALFTLAFLATALAQSVPTSNLTVIIAGGGTIGLSTAYWLSKDARYTHIKILDPYPAPSFASAGNDINKIVRTEYEDPLYSYIANEAIELWKSDPVFNPAFVKSGYLSGTYEPEGSYWDLAVRNTQQYGNATELEPIIGDPRVAFQKWPWFRGVPPVGFRGAYNANGGWVNAAGALERVARHLRTLEPRVQFVTGQRGTVQQLVREDTTGRVSGVLAADGTWHRGDLVVVSMGAWSTRLLDFEGQAWPSMSMVTHLRLTEAETASLKNMSVFDIWAPGDRPDQAAGYVLPPNAKGQFKIVAKVKNHNRYTKLDSSGKRIPPAVVDAHRPQNQLPEQDATDYRNFLRTWFPQFAEKEFSGSQGCWTLSTFDDTWLIGPHPSSPETLYLATGGNGHTFKNIVNIGKYVKESIEGKLHPNMVTAFSWRPSKVSGYGAPPALNNIDQADLVNDGEDENESEGGFGLFGGFGLLGGRGG